MCPSVTAFAITLGPTNPWMINIAKETLDFRPAGISPALRLLVPTFSLLDAPLALAGQASQQTRTLSYLANTPYWRADSRRIYAEIRRKYNTINVLLYFRVIPHSFRIFCASVRSTDDLTFGTMLSPDYLRCKIS